MQYLLFKKNTGFTYQDIIKQFSGPYQVLSLITTGGE